jgi:hypothetical protein
LRVATRFFALAMIVPVKYAAGKPISNQANYADIILSVIRHATFIPHPADNALHDAREKQRARPTGREVAKQTRSNFLSRLRGPEPQYHRVHGGPGGSGRKHRAEGCGLRVTIRLTRFVVGETLISVGQDADYRYVMAHAIDAECRTDR